MNRATILLGCNVGECKNTFNLVFDAINSEIGTITKMSSCYETAAWGKEDQPPFLNQVIEVETTYNAFDLLSATTEIENRMGRTREEINNPRRLDLDILFFNSEQVITKTLIIPHPRLHLRKFTLIPLNEIIPAFTHPSLGKTIQQLLDECPDQLEVKKL